MANGIRIVWDYGALEDIEDSYIGRAMEEAKKVKKRADAMRSSDSVAEFKAIERHSPPSKRKSKHSKGWRRYAVVSALAPSTVADNARYNILPKAMK